MEWQPIETAPKFKPFDDSFPRCLVYGPDLGVCVGCAGTDTSGRVYVHVSHVSGDVNKLVTHWMPLPPPPKG